MDPAATLQTSFGQFEILKARHLQKTTTARLDCLVRNDDGHAMSYAGGKGRLWQEIVALMPPHDTYVETHLGGGAVLKNKRPATTSFGIDLDHRVIETASTWDVPGLHLHHGDALDFLGSRSWTPNTLIYADPPYVASTKSNRRYYRHEYTDADHGQLLEALAQLPCLVMISGYRCVLYDDALQKWERRDLVNITHTGPRVESIWANFTFAAELHDYSTVGAGFRERDRIKRKAARWVRKLELMPPIEQRAVLDALIRSQVGTDRDLTRQLFGAGGGQAQ